MMVLEKSDIFVRHLLSIHLLHSVCKDTTIQTDEILLRKFADESGEILLLDICIGVILASGSRIFSLTILDEEIEMVTHFPVFHMSLSVKHVCLGHSKVLLGHKTDLHLILDLFHMHTLGNAYM